MRVMMIGVDYRTATVGLRERLALASDSAAALRDDIREKFKQVEAVVLSTCNRTELYLAYKPKQKIDTSKINAILAKHTRVKEEELSNIVTRIEQKEAVLHLFRVACGIDSMVIGEPEILGQVKRAYEEAVKTNCVGSALHHIFQKALATARHARRATGIGQGRLSVASVAVDMAKQMFVDFSDKTILSIGAGKMTKTMLGYLADLEPKNLWLINRTLAGAQELWGQLYSNTTEQAKENWGVGKFENLDKLLVDADIVLTSTSSDKPIITAQSFKKIYKQRDNKPIFLIDIAVPRDIESQVNSFKDVHLYNIDDLQEVVAKNAAGRVDEIDRCQQHLTKSVEATIRQISHQEVGTLARQLRTQLHELGNQEAGRTIRKLNQATQKNQVDNQEQIEEILSEHTRRLVNKILHTPLSRLDQHKASATLDFYSDALSELFDLEIENNPNH